MRLIDLEGGFKLHTPKSVGREGSKAWSAVPHFSPSPPRLTFLALCDFHARSRFARSAIPEEKWGTTRSLILVQSSVFIDRLCASCRVALHAQL